jgi:hypothetical protein
LHSIGQHEENRKSLTKPTLRPLIRLAGVSAKFRVYHVTQGRLCQWQITEDKESFHFNRLNGLIWSHLKQLKPVDSWTHVGRTDSSGSARLSICARACLTGGIDHPALFACECESSAWDWRSRFGTTSGSLSMHIAASKMPGPLPRLICWWKTRNVRWFRIRLSASQLSPWASANHGLQQVKCNNLGDCRESDIPFQAVLIRPIFGTEMSITSKRR